MPPTTTLAELLAELGVVGPRQAAAGGDLDAYLAALTQSSAYWDAARPGLTPYQAAQIRKFHPGQPNKLRQSLRVGDYLVLAPIGRGGMGVVHLGADPRTGELFALKKIRTDSPTARRDLKREFEAMRRLADNPAVVQAIALVPSGKSEVLVMEYQNLGDLSDHVRRKPMRWREVVRWAATLLDGLDAAHRQGMVHRDIKPQNVMVHRTADRELVRLSDWGLVKSRAAVETQATAAGTIRGTFDYMPPEQWKGSQHVVAASDLYALGGTIFYALTQGPPFPVETAGDMLALCSAHTQRERPRVRDRRPEVPGRLDDLVQRMMHRDPTRRGTAGELRREFLAILHAEPSGQHEARPEPSPPPRPAPLRSAGTTAPPARTATAAPAARPQFLTPSQLEASRRAGVALPTAAARLLRALRAWGRQRGDGGHWSAMAGRELRESWLVFRSSAARWIDPRQSPARVAVTLTLVGGAVAGGWWATR